MKNPLSEKLLLYKVRKNKDPESYAKLYDIYVARIYRFIYFKVSREEDAQDLCSEVFLKTWQYLTSDNKVKSFQALLYQIARHVVIDFYRKKATHEIASDEEMLSKIEENKSLADQIDLKLEYENIEKHLKKLKDQYREILLLKYLEQMSIEEIAGIVNKTKGNVRVILYRAVKALKELVDEAGRRD